MRGLNDTIKSRAAQLSQWMEELSERRLVERINTSNQLYGCMLCEVRGGDEGRELWKH